MAMIDLKLTDYVYTNVQINNNTNNYIACQYNETQNLPILTQQQDFQVRVVRLKIPMSAVPLFHYEADKYFISFGLGSVIAGGDFIQNVLPPQEVLFVSERNPAMEPINTFGAPFAASVYSYQDFLDAINLALSLIWNSAIGNAAYTGIGAPLAGLPEPTELPYFRLDCGCNNFEFVAPSKAGAVPNANPSIWYPSNPIGVRILMSEPLYALLNGFPAYFFGPDGVPAEPKVAWALNIYEEACNIVTCPPWRTAQTLWTVIPQEQSSVYAWQHASRIIITTNIALHKEIVLVASNGGRPRKLEVLTDFSIPQSSIDSTKEYLTYDNTDSDRWLNIEDMGTLRTIDLKVFVQFIDLQTFQLQIAPGHEFNTKLGFRRKLSNESFQISGQAYGKNATIQPLVRG